MRNLAKREIKKAVKRTTVIVLLSLTFMMLLTPILVHAISWKLYHWNSAETLSEWEFTPPHIPLMSQHVNTTAGYYQEGNGSLQLHTVPETQGTVEFLLNNGFEDGVIAPWTGAATISSTYYHNGSKSMNVDAYAYTTYTFTPFQTHKANVSLFEFWSRYPSGGGSNGQPVILYENSTGANKERLMSVVYSTSSFVKTVIVNSTYIMPAWNNIEANSIIKGIKVLTHYSSPWYVDDFTFEGKYTYGNSVGWTYGLQAKYPIKEYLKEDYIINPSFEEPIGAGNWTGGVVRSSAQARTGSWSGLLNYADAQQTWNYTSAPLKEDVKEFSFWTKDCPISSTSLSVQYYNGTGYYWVSSFGLLNSAGVWKKDIVKNETQYYGLWATIPAGAYITGIRITEYGGYTWYVDDVSLKAWAQSGFDFNPITSQDWILIHSRDYFAFWIYIDVDTFPSHTVNFIAGRRWLVLDSSNFYFQGIQIYKASGSTQVQYKHTYCLNQSGDPFTNVANKVWLYVEMHDYQFDGSTTAYEMHINGIARTTLFVTPEVLHNWGIFYVKFPVSTYVGMAFVDYINVNSAWQFPPLYPEDLADIDVDTPDLEAEEWVFAQEKFYTFNVTARVPVGVSAWDFVSLSFLDEGDHNCTVLYDVANNEFTIPYESENEHERYIRVQQVEGMPLQDPVDNRTFYIDFEIWFTENIVDTYDHLIDIYGWGNYSTGEFETFLIGEDVFKIYNRGGFSLNYETTGSSAYRIAGGDTFEFYAQSSMAVNGTEWVYADYLWRNLQHIKELFQIQARVAYPAFTLSYGMDYYAEGGWIHGWELQLDAINITVPRVSGSEAYWAWRAEWYLNDVFIKQDYFFTFPQGNPLNDGDYASSRIWLDFWFNSMNGSSTWGGRVNSYYYPVKDNADAWLRVLSTNWGADDKRAKESLCFGTLRHNDGSPLQTQEIVFVKAWSKVTVANHASLTQKVTQFYADVQDLTLGRIPLIGIQTPAFDETKMPALQTGGFLGALFSGFQWVGKWLADNIVWGGLNLWGNFVGFLDTIAAMFGAPNFFTNLFTRIGEGIDYMVQGFTYAFQILVQIFILIGTLLATFVTVLTDLVTSMINTITTLQDIMSGAIGGAGNLWNDLGISSWLTVALIFYPLYLIFLWEDEGMEPVLQQLGWIFGIASWLFTFFIQIIQFVIGMITSIIESIPIAE